MNPGTRPTAAGGFVPNFRQNDNSRQIMRDFLEIQHSNLRIADKRTADEAAVRAAAGLTPKTNLLRTATKARDLRLYTEAYALRASIRII